MLHYALYERLLAFCATYTPEFPGEPVVDAWMERLYKDDPDLYLMVDLEDNYTILGHAVICVERPFGIPCIHCYQGQGERKSVTGITVFGELVDKIAASIGARRASFFTEGRSKALEKLGYKVIRTQMTKTYGEGD